MRKHQDADIDAPLPLGGLLLSTLWIAVRLLAAYVMAMQVSPFFYQNF